jgi:hypothetical protein
MAFTPLVPAAANIAGSLSGDLAYKLGPIRDFAGAAVDLSAFVSTAVNVYATNITSTEVNPNVLLTLATAPVGDSSGNLTGIVQQNEVAGTLLPGTAYQYSLVGKPTSGDSLQLLASGTLTIKL